jgi:hypothetical protein
MGRSYKGDGTINKQITYLLQTRATNKATDLTARSNGRPSLAYVLEWACVQVH